MLPDQSEADSWRETTQRLFRLCAAYRSEDLAAALIARPGSRFETA